MRNLAGLALLLGVLAAAWWHRDVWLWVLKDPLASRANEIRPMRQHAAASADRANALFSQKRYEEALAVFEATQHTRGQATVLVALGRAHTRAARYDLAQAQLRRAVKLYAKLDDADRYAEALELLGIAEAARGDVDAARRTLTDAGLAYRYAGAPKDAERIAGRLQELAPMSTLGEQ